VHPQHMLVIGMVVPFDGHLAFLELTIVADLAYVACPAEDVADAHSSTICVCSNLQSTRRRPSSAQRVRFSPLGYLSAGMLAVQD